MENFKTIYNENKKFTKQIIPGITILKMFQNIL